MEWFREKEMNSDTIYALFIRDQVTDSWTLMCFEYETYYDEYNDLVSNENCTNIDLSKTRVELDINDDGILKTITFEDGEKKSINNNCKILIIDATFYDGYLSSVKYEQTILNCYISVGSPNEVLAEEVYVVATAIDDVRTLMSWNIDFWNKNPSYRFEFDSNMEIRSIYDFNSNTKFYVGKYQTARIHNENGDYQFANVYRNCDQIYGKDIPTSVTIGKCNVPDAFNWGHDCFVHYIHHETYDFIEVDLEDRKNSYIKLFKPGKFINEYYLSCDYERRWLDIEKGELHVNDKVYRDGKLI